MRCVSLLIVAAILGPAAQLEAARIQSPRRPNVVILLADDLGYGDLSCHGNPVLKTPALDRLHAESVRLTDFHVSPMCTPTRGQLMTGVDALRNGAMNVSSGRAMLRPEFPTMAELFAAADYQCGIFGKWHLGDVYPYLPMQRGFHEAVYFKSSYIGAAADYWGNDYFDDTYWHNGLQQKYSGYCTDVFFSAASRFIDKACDKQQPFFVYLPLNAAHWPYFVPDKYRQPYANQSADVASFFGMMANIDENVAQLDKLLTERGARDNTIFIYLTDNGGTAGVPVFNAEMRGKKTQLYDGGHRVPCFIRWPEGQLGSPRDVAALTEVQDLLPTLKDLCNLPNTGKPKFDGVSLAGLLREGKPLADRMCVVQFSRLNAAVPKQGDACVLWNQWRLVGNEELYDIRQDPAQEKNIAADHADVVARMQAHYAAWWSEVAPRVNEPSPIVVGHEQANPVVLTPADWFNVFLDQQGQIRNGLHRNGVWHLRIHKAGEYEITLRRWPVEADLPIIPPSARPGAKTASRARLKLGEMAREAEIKKDQRGVTFDVTLLEGSTTLQTWFDDASGDELYGAYYVHIRRK